MLANNIVVSKVRKNEEAASSGWFPKSATIKVYSMQGLNWFDKRRLKQVLGQQYPNANLYTTSHGVVVYDRPPSDSLTSVQEGAVEHLPYDLLELMVSTYKNYFTATWQAIMICALPNGTGGILMYNRATLHYFPLSLQATPYSNVMQAILQKVQDIATHMRQFSGITGVIPVYFWCAPCMQAYIPQQVAGVKMLVTVVGFNNAVVKSLYRRKTQPMATLRAQMSLHQLLLRNVLVLSSIIGATTYLGKAGYSYWIAMQQLRSTQRQYAALRGQLPPWQWQRSEQIAALPSPNISPILTTLETVAYYLPLFFKVQAVAVASAKITLHLHGPGLSKMALAKIHQDMQCHAPNVTLALLPEELAAPQSIAQAISRPSPYRLELILRGSG